MTRRCLLLCLLLPAFVHAADAPGDPKAKVNAVLDDWHKAAAQADEARYFGHFTADAVFMGTDATERWTRDEFRAWAKPYFTKGKAWSFQSTRRGVSFSKDGGVAWFDEDLSTPNMGPCRGSGVLVRDGEAWKIAHYNLTVPIPNDALPEVTKLIEAALKKKTLQTVQLKPNPRGKDKTRNSATATQLGAEWADIQNIGSRDVDLAGVQLHHIAYRAGSSAGRWELVINFTTGVLKPRQVLRVHAGRGNDLLVLRQEDLAGADYHVFTGRDAYTWNNDRGDCASLWMTGSSAPFDSACYAAKPPEGVVLKRMGDQLVP